MRKVSVLKRDQGLQLFLKNKGKVSNKQGELLLNLVWSRIIFQKQVPEQLQTGVRKSLKIGARTAPEQAQKQILEQAWKQASEQALNLLYQVLQQE